MSTDAKEVPATAASGWRLDTDNGSMAPLDRMLGGGIRPGELMLIGGAQGTGKTTMALQMARNVAASGQAFVLYVNFEHDDADMLNRLIAMESVLPHLPNTKPSTGAINSSITW